MKKYFTYKTFTMCIAFSAYMLFLHGSFEWGCYAAFLYIFCKLETIDSFLEISLKWREITVRRFLKYNREANERHYDYVHMQLQKELEKNDHIGEVGKMEKK